MLFSNQVAVVALALAAGACAFPKAEKVAGGSGGASSSSTGATSSGSVTVGPGAGGGGAGTCASADSPIPCEGLELWLDASSLREGPIAIWPDLSPKAHQVTQKSAALQPIAAASPGLRGHVLAEFDGTNDFLAVDEGFAALNTALTVVLVVVPRDTSVDYQPVLYLAADMTDLRYIAVYLRKEDWEFNANDYGAGDTGVLEQGVAVRLQAKTDWLSGTAMRLCRPELDHNGIPGPDAGSLGVNFIGNAVKDAALKGGVAELIVYSRVLTNPETAQVDTYLATKWGVCP